MKYKYIEFPSDYKYVVFTIKSSIDDYRLTFYINNALKINLSMINFLKSEFKENEYYQFPFFFYEDKISKNTFYFIGNNGHNNNIENISTKEDLFAEETKFNIKFLGKRSNSIYSFDSTTPDFLLIIGYPPSHEIAPNITTLIRNIPNINSVSSFDINKIKNSNQLLADIELNILLYSKMLNEKIKKKKNILNSNT